eukprot:18736-Heterococcus_DN1.PRE.4
MELKMKTSWVEREKACCPCFGARNIIQNARGLVFRHCGIKSAEGVESTALARECMRNMLEASSPRCADGLRSSKSLEVACVNRNTTSTIVPLTWVAVTPYMRPARQTHEESQHTHFLQETHTARKQLLQKVSDLVSYRPS